MSSAALKPALDEYANLDLQIAAEDLFLRRRQGHLDPFYYSTPAYAGDPVRGSQIWAQLIQTTTNYKIPAQEAALIKEAAPSLDRFAGRYDQFIDFGPGSVEAFNAKSRPLLDRLTVDTYRPIDLCGDFLEEIGVVMKHIDPAMKIKAELRDFLADPPAPARKPSWLYWGGLGFANIPTTDSNIPVAGIRERLTLMKGVLAAGGHCMFSIDTTNNENALLETYHHPLVVSFITNLLHQINRDCPDIIVDPTGWTYRPVWRPDRFVVEHHLVALRKQTIQLPSCRIQVKTGESFVTDNSFKLPAAFVSEIAESVGWRREMTLGDDGHVQLLTLSMDRQ